MAEPVQALKAKSQRDLGITRSGRLLFELRNARMTIDRCVDAVAAKKSFYRAMITAGMAGLIARRKRFVNVIFQAERFAANGMDHRVTVTPEFRIFRLELFNKLQHVLGRVGLQRFTEKLIETFSGRSAAQARLCCV